MAGVFAGAVPSALVFRGDDGLDELTTTTTSHGVGGPRRAGRAEHVLDPPALGIAPATAGGLRGGDARVQRRGGPAAAGRRAGPVRDAVLLNAAAALVALDGGRAGRCEALAGGCARAAEAVDSGAAAARCSRWLESEPVAATG